MPINDVTINSIDSEASEKIEITRSKSTDFITVLRSTLTERKEKFQHVQGKTHVIVGDVTCKIRTEHMYKGQPKDPIVEGTTFGRIVHGGKECADSKCMYVRKTDDIVHGQRFGSRGQSERRSARRLRTRNFRKAYRREVMAGARWVCHGFQAPSCQIQMRSPAGDAFTV